MKSPPYFCNRVEYINDKLSNLKYVLCVFQAQKDQSPYSITNAGHTVTFENQACKIKNKAGKLIGNIPASARGLLKVEHSYLAADSTPVEQINIHELHRHLGHMPANAIHALIQNQTIKGIQLIDNGSPIICDSCEYAKMTHKVILKECKAPPAKHFSDEVHTDLWGPSPIASLSEQ